MGSLVHDYVEEFVNVKGDNLLKIKALINRHMEQWEWYEGERVIKDMLKDDSMTAEDVLEMLQLASEHDEGNHDFKMAVRAMDIAIKRERLAYMAEHQPNNVESFFDKFGPGHLPHAV